MADASYSDLWVLSDMRLLYYFEPKFYFELPIMAFGRSGVVHNDARIIEEDFWEAATHRLPQHLQLFCRPRLFDSLSNG
jgi:hypothetical protein